MNRKIRILFILILFSVGPVCGGINDKITECFNSESENAAVFKWRNCGKKLPETEKISYKVYWKFIKVGEAVLEIKGIEEINGRGTYRISSTAKTLPVLDVFYKVRDKNDSWLDAESFCSLKVLSDIREGGWRIKQETDFDHINEKFILREEGEFTVGDTKRWVLDVLSALYYLRTFELEYGDVYSFDVNAGKDTWILKTRVTGREQVKTDMGDFDCFILEPAVRENAGIFRSSGGLKVWVTADERKIPVKMKTKIPIGSVVAEACGYENIDETEVK